MPCHSGFFSVEEIMRSKTKSNLSYVWAHSKYPVID